MKVKKGCFLPREVNNNYITVSPYMPCKYFEWAYMYDNNKNNIFGPEEDLKEFLQLINKWKKNKYGLLDYNGKIILDFKYDEILLPTKEQTEKSDSKIAIVDGKIYNIKDSKFISTKFKNIGIPYTSIDLIAVSDGKKWGFINPDGKLEIDYKYDWASCFYKGYASVRIGDQTNIINSSEEILFTIDNCKTLRHCEKNDEVCGICYSDNEEEKQGYAIKDGKKFKEVIPCKYDRISVLENKYVIVENNLKSGIVNMQNDIIIPIVYDLVWWFAGKFIVLNNNNLYCWKNGDLELIIDNIDEFGVFEYSPEYLLIKSNFRYGLMDKNFKVIIPIIYNVLSIPKNALDIVLASNGKIGVIDFNNNVIIDFKYDSISALTNKKIMVMKRKMIRGNNCTEWTIIDRNDVNLLEV